MRHVFLPIEHSDDDLTLAGQVAECLESRSLYVTWTGLDYRRPDVETVWREVEAEAPAAGPAPPPSVWVEAVATVVAFIAALCKPRATA